MRYLFFDIECSDGTHICTFGYVLTDSNFNVLDKQDLLINPEAPFNVGNRAFDRKITLAYPPSVFRRQPTFAERYDEIHALLTAEDTLVCGHAVENDVGFLLTACRRYGLDLPGFRYVDSQKLYRKAKGDANDKALEKIMEELQIEGGTLHKSDDDALCSMLTVRALCAEKQCAFESLIRGDAESVGDSGAFAARWLQARRLNRYRKICQNLRYAVNPPDSAVKGKYFAFSEEIERVYCGKLVSAVRILTELGGRWRGNIYRLHYFVRGAEPGKRLRKVEAINREHPREKIEIITLQRFLAMIGIDWGALEEEDLDTDLLPTRTGKPLEATLKDAVRRAPKPQKPKSSRPKKEEPDQSI